MPCASDRHGRTVSSAICAQSVFELDDEPPRDGRAEPDARRHPRADVAHEVVAVEVHVVGDVGGHVHDDAVALLDGLTHDAALRRAALDPDADDGRLRGGGVVSVVVVVVVGGAVVVVVVVVSVVSAASSSPPQDASASPATNAAARRGTRTESRPRRCTFETLARGMLRGSPKERRIPG